MWLANHVISADGNVTLNVPPLIVVARSCGCLTAHNAFTVTKRGMGEWRTLASLLIATGVLTAAKNESSLDWLPISILMNGICHLNLSGCAGEPITDTSRSLIVTKYYSILDW